MKQHPTYGELVQQKGNLITYADLLGCAEWKAKREQVLKRDDYTCHVCKGKENCMAPHPETGLPSPHEPCIVVGGSKKYLFVDPHGKLVEYNIINSHSLMLLPADKIRRMQVHHIIYYYGKLPWEYDEGYLRTMCGDCHAEWHKNNDVWMLKQNEEGKWKVEILKKCYRCGGSGYLPQFGHVQGGVCFRCGGSGIG